jgi:hypothetical protein
MTPDEIKILEMLLKKLSDTTKSEQIRFKTRDLLNNIKR